MSRITKKKIHEILTLANPGDMTARIFYFFIMALISLNVIAVILESIESLAIRYKDFFWSFEVFSVAVFTVEYFLRLWTANIDPRFKGHITGRIRYSLTPMALIDLVAIIPFYLPMFITVDLRFVRILRLFRLFRLFKMGRYSRSMKTLINVISSKKEELLITVFTVMVLLIFASSLMYYVENEAQPEAFSSIPAAMWWGAVTLTTVGYGDVYPITALGKFLGIIIALLGIGMFALPAGILGSGFVEELQKGREKRRRFCPHCGKDIDEPPNL